MVRSLPSRRLGLLLAVVALAASSACGSTVPSNSLAGTAEAAGLDGTVQPGATQVAATVPGETSAPGSTGSAGGGVSSVPTASNGVGVGTTPAGPASASTVSRVIPNGAIRVGFLNTDIPTKQAQQLGVDTGQSYDPKDWFFALVKNLNKHGGIGGHQIDPVVSNVRPLANSWQTEYERACAELAQDKKVAVVVGYTFITEDSFLNCLTKARIPQVAIAAFEPDDTQLAGAPFYFGLGPSKNRDLALLLNGPFNDGFLTPKNKIGIVTGSCAFEVRAMAKTWDPLVKKLGLTEAARQTITCPDGAAQGSTTVQQIQAAVLKFRSAGVDRVYAASGALLFFTQTAENQGYHPGYILDSNTSGGQVEAQNIPKAQLRNMRGYGWAPFMDVGPPRQLPLTAAAKSCFELYKESGLKATKFADFSNAIGICDTLLLYKRAVELGTSIDAARVASSIEGLGTSFGSAWTYDMKISFGSGRHTGATFYRPWAFVDACSCFNYTRGASNTAF